MQGCDRNAFWNSWPRFWVGAGIVFLAAGCQSAIVLPAPADPNGTDIGAKNPALATPGAVMPRPESQPSGENTPTLTDPNLVALAPLKVERREVEYEISNSADRQHAQTVVVSWVSPARYKMGIRVGDRLMSIDGKPVGEVPVAELRRILEGQLSPGETHPVSFNGRRRQGLRWVTITFTGGIWEPGLADLPAGSILPGNSLSNPASSHE